MGEKKQKMVRQLHLTNGSTLQYRDPPPKDAMRGATTEHFATDAPGPDFDPTVARILNSVLTDKAKAAQIVGPYAASLQYLTSWLVSALPADDQIKALMVGPIRNIIILVFAVGWLTGKENDGRDV